MQGALPEELAMLDEQLNAAERDARELVAGLIEPLGSWREQPNSWSVAECLDHLATANRVYLRAMEPAAKRAHASNRVRLGPAVPGLLGGLFVRYLEPPVNGWLTSRSPRAIRPRTGPGLADAMTMFLESHDQVRRFLRSHAAIDLADVRFPNPFLAGVRFSLATGLHVIAAHERRHLWQARRVRAAAELRRATGDV